MEDAFVCVVDKVVFKGDRGWAVIRARRAGKAITVTGALLGVVPGDHLRVTGVWESHSRFGLQFKATTCLSELPDTREGVARWLSKRVSSLSWQTAFELVSRFGLEGLWPIIQREPERLKEVHGIDDALMEAIVDTCKRFDAERELVGWLYGIGLTDTAVTETLNRFGTRTKAEIEKDPYILYYEVSGIGFDLADRIATQGLKLEKDDARRVAACARSVISKNALVAGSVYMEYGLCVMQSAIELSLDLPQVEQLLIGATEVCVTLDRRFVSTRPLFEAEGKIAGYVAKRLVRPVEEPPALEEERSDRVIDEDHYVIMATARGALVLFMAWFVWDVSWGEALRLVAQGGEKIGVPRLPTIFIPLAEARHHIASAELARLRGLDQWSCEYCDGYGCEACQGQSE